MDSQRVSDRFRAWVARQALAGHQVRAIDDGHYQADAGSAVAMVNFYPMDEGPDIVELRIARMPGEEQLFFLHFMMEDYVRAKEQFLQLDEAFDEVLERRVDHVLLCCTCGMTTTMFAGKLNALAQTLGMGLDFEARPLEAALRGQADYAAVMLAPQVAHLRGKVAAAFPGSAVFEMPGKVFGSFDAPAALRLVEHVLDRRNTKSVVGSGDAAPLAPMDSANVWEGRVMVVSAVLGARLTTYEYRVYDGGEEVLRGHTDHKGFDYRDIEDLLATARLAGHDLSDLDAIGVSVPGIVDGGKVTLLSLEEPIRNYDLGSHLEQAFGTHVFLDNDANAAAVGVYLTQRTYRSITFHREDFGHAGCGQGVVADGRVLTGRRNFAGELNHLVDALSFSADPHDLAWTEEGLGEVVSRFLLCNICACAPEAIYVDAWPVTDMGKLREELVPFLGEEYVPDLICAPDFNECVFFGELALITQRLRASR